MNCNRAYDHRTVCSIKQLLYDLVLVPSRLDRLVLLAQFNGSFRVALQVHVRWMIVQAGQGNHLFLHLEDQCILPE